MGTRNLTAVYIDGEYKVAQYGQWDGYPNGQGLTALHFLRDEMKEDIFKNAVRNSSVITKEEMDALLYENGENLYRAHPEFSRDTGAEILEILQNHPSGMKLTDSIGFAADSIFCEWAYVIDFDNNTFEVYKGWNDKRELTPEDRFYFLRGYESDEYHGITLEKEWRLTELPTDEEFLKAFGLEVEDE